uniref:F-box domain-containing protein n=1 Tax=Strongyloides papillosus TaxID=174720 RepID=A0A0N5BSY4_STREA
MVTKNDSTLLELMEIGLIRKKILRKIISFHDICNLAKTCSQMNFIIQHEKIKRSFMCYEDKQIVEIKINENFQSDLGIPELEDIEFEKYNNSFQRINDLKLFHGEAICLKSCIIFYIHDVVEDFDKKERLLFVKRLVEELNFNSEIRKSTKILNFNIDSFDNHDIILHSLCYINHSNIRRIEVPDTIFTGDKSKYDKLKCNIFENLPKFHELVIYATPSVDTCRRLVENKSIIEKVLKELSKKKNATLILGNLYHYYNKIISFADIFIEITRKYKIRIKCSVNFNCNRLFNRSCRNCSNEVCIFYPIKELVTSLKFESENFDKLFNVMKNWQYFTNLELLELSVSNIDINKCFEKVNVSNCSLLLKECTKLRKIKLNLNISYNESDESKIQTVHNNLEFLIQLMPNTIQTLELINIADLTNNLSNLINKYMQNIKILIMDHVSFKDSDCLISFKNLECFILNENCIVQIPKNIKLFGIGHRNSKINNNSEIINIYTKKYSKCLKSMNDQYIFFNEIKYWDMYKNLIHDILI